MGYSRPHLSGYYTLWIPLQLDLFSFRGTEEGGRGEHQHGHAMFVNLCVDFENTLIFYCPVSLRLFIIEAKDTCSVIGNILVCHQLLHFTQS